MATWLWERRTLHQSCGLPVSSQGPLGIVRLGSRRALSALAILEDQPPIQQTVLRLDDCTGEWICPQGTIYLAISIMNAKLTTPNGIHTRVRITNLAMERILTKLRRDASFN